MALPPPSPSPLPRPVSRKPPRQRANRADLFNVVRERIARHDYRPGAKLLENDLAREFKVSRARVRETFGALESRGLILRVPNRGAEVARLDISQMFEIYDVREVLEGLCTRLAVGGYHEVTIWDAVSGALVRRIGGMPERITSLAWHPARNVIAVAGGVPSQWGGVALVNAGAGFQVRYLCDLPESALSVAFSPDGSQLAAGGGDRTIRFFDTTSGKQTRLLKQHADWVQSVAFSPDGRLLVSASRDRTARIFDAKSGELDATYSEHETPLLGAVFAGSKTLVSLARARSLNVWNADNAERRAEFKDLASDVQTIAASPFGLLTGSSDAAVRVYQFSNQREIFTLRGHRDVVQSLAVAPSGEVFASGGADGVVCVWSLACGTWVARFVASPM